MTWLWILYVLGATLFDLGLIWVVIKVGWGPWARRYPPQEPAPDAVRRGFQSFRFGLMNFGFALHVAADEDFLHLRPIMPLRWVGAGPISIPWSLIQPSGKKTFGRWMNAKIGGKAVAGPSWCLELADNHDTADGSG